MTNDELAQTVAKLIVHYKTIMFHYAFEDAYNGVDTKNHDQRLAIMWFGAATAYHTPIKGDQRSMESSFSSAINFNIFTPDEEEQVKVKFNLEYNGNHLVSQAGIGDDTSDFIEPDGSLSEYKGINQSPTTPHDAVKVYRQSSNTTVDIWEVKNRKYIRKLKTVDGFNFKEHNYNFKPDWMSLLDFVNLKRGILLPLIDKYVNELGYTWPKYIQIH